MRSISVVIHAQPLAKGSMRAFISRKTQRAVIIDQSYHALRLYESILRDHLARAMNGQSLFEGPVRVDITFHRTRPKSKRPKRDDAVEYVATRPDIDKMTRAVLDAMTGIVFDDDSQVAVLHVAKVYADRTYVEITAEEIE